MEMSFSRAVVIAVIGVSTCAGATRPFRVNLPAEARPYEKTAASELETYLDRIFTGGKLSVGGTERVAFHVGDTAFARERGLGKETFQDEEWAVKSFGGDIVLAGGGTRGTLYAVSRFLEDDCGVRWWFRGDEDVPERADIRIEGIDRRGKPYFRYREIYVNSDLDERTAIRRRLNANGKGMISKAWGGGIVAGSPHHCHVWDRYIPWAKYGKDHPEWFSLVGGRRLGGMSNGQLCLTNPEVTDMLEKGVRASIAKDRARAARNPRLSVPLIYDLSMNDNGRYCECEKCRTEAERYGLSGLQLKFANEIARRIGKDFPELMFTVLAYHYSEHVPLGGMRAEDNVIVRLCTTRQNMPAGIHEESNRFVKDKIASWHRYAKNLFIWDYAILFRRPLVGFPFASEFHIPGKYKFYAENGVAGVFLEHENPDKSDMYELKFYLESRMMEDPFQDADALYADFMTRYYGRAAGKITDARRRLDRIRRERAAHIPWFPTFNNYNFITDAEIEEIDSVFREALDIARGDEKLTKRVARAKLSMDRLRGYRRAFGRQRPPENGVSDKPFFDFPVDTDPDVYTRHDRTGKFFTCVRDPELGGKRVWRINVYLAGEKSYYNLPFMMGVHSKGKVKKSAKKLWDKPIGPGYNWYDLGEVELPDSYITYFTRSWTLDIPAGAPGLSDVRRGVKALVKFTGPKYFPGSTDTNAIFIARTVFY